MGSSHRFAIDDFDFELVILRVYVTLCLIGTHFSPELCNSLFNWHPYSHHSLGGLHWLLMGFDHCNFASPNFAHSCPGDLWHCLNYLPPNDWRWMLVSGNPNSSLMSALKRRQTGFISEIWNAGNWCDLYSSLQPIIFALFSKGTQIFFK